MYNIGDFVEVNDATTGDGVLQELQRGGISTKGSYIVVEVLPYGTIEYLKIRSSLAACPIVCIGPVSGEYFEKILQRPC